ncbi:MAG: hypothetical protein WD043_11355 [Gemmatimonadales bacterium]
MKIKRFQPVVALACLLLGPPGQGLPHESTHHETLAQGATTQAEGLVRYRVRPVHGDTLVRLDITVTFQAGAEGRTRVAMPADRFGVQDMYQWVLGPDADAGVRLEQVEPGVYLAHHEPGRQVQVSYTLAYDPRAAGFVAFGPDVGPDHFHFFGSQWMARVGATDGPRHVEVTFDLQAWTDPVGSSYGIGAGPHVVEATDYDLDYSVIAGGGYRTARASCRGRPVMTMVHGAFAIADHEIFSLVERIVCGQREAFDDFDRPFFTVFITERERLEAGAPLLNGFTAFLEPDIAFAELRGLLAHEMIHTWFPRSACLVDPARPEASEAWTRWFHEGFTEYLARRVLVDQGLASLDWMVDRTNEDLERLGYHPYRTLTLEELEAAMRERRYNNHHHRLHYLRGALLALNWDTGIRTASRGERSLLDAMRQVVAGARRSGGTITTPQFHEILHSLGVESRADIRRHLEQGEALAPAARALGPDFQLVRRRAPAFEPGLSMASLIESDRVAEIVPGGAAERAGLREGAVVAGTENAAPWTGRWDPRAPMVLLVVSGGERRRVVIDATAGEIEIPVFRRVPR